MWVRMYCNVPRAKVQVTHCQWLWVCIYATRFVGREGQGGCQWLSLARFKGEGVEVTLKGPECASTARFRRSRVKVTISGCVRACAARSKVRGGGGGVKVTISGCGCACAANRQSGAGLELSQKATFGGNFSKTGWSLYGLSPRTLIAFSTEPIFTLQFPRRNTADRENKILRAENQGLSKSLWVVFLFKRNLTVGYNVA